MSGSDRRAPPADPCCELAGFSAFALYSLEREVAEAIWNACGRVLRRNGFVTAVVLECPHWVVAAVWRDDDGVPEAEEAEGAARGEGRAP